MTLCQRMDANLNRTPSDGGMHEKPRAETLHANGIVIHVLQLINPASTHGYNEGIMILIMGQQLSTLVMEVFYKGPR